MVNCPKRTVHHFQLGNNANQQSGRHDDVIKWMKARAVWEQKESEPLGHCAASNPKRSFRPRIDEICASYAMKREKSRLRILLREKPPGKESELKRQRQRFGNSRRKWGKLTPGDWCTESPKWVDKRSWLPSETVWLISQVPRMGRMGRMRMVKRQSRVCWAKMTNPAGWWAHSPKWYSSTWRGFGRSRRSLNNRRDLAGRTQPTITVREIWSTAHLIWCYQEMLNR